jgi:hypothetical protein
MSGSFTATFIVPAGMEIVNFGLLQKNVEIDYSDDNTFQLIGAYFSDPTVSDHVISGTYTLNIFNPDFGARSCIKDSSNVTLYAMAQFGHKSGQT